MEKIKVTHNSLNLRQSLPASRADLHEFATYNYISTHMILWGFVCFYKNIIIMPHIHFVTCFLFLESYIEWLALSFVNNSVPTSSWPSMKEKKTLLISLPRLSVRRSFPVESSPAPVHQLSFLKQRNPIVPQRHRFFKGIPAHEDRLARVPMSFLP